MNLPNDPIILLSVINTLLRDKYANLQSLCDDYNVNEIDIVNKLSLVGYIYNESQNQFK